MKNKQKFIDAIKSDCAIAEQYINFNGETCAIGCLAKIVNADIDLLREFNNCFIWSIHLNSVAIKIMEEFDLSKDDLIEIQGRNDFYNTPIMRQNAIFDYIEQKYPNSFDI